MAPRSAKSKKPVDVKVIDEEAPKKGRAKTKNIEELESETAEIELDKKGESITVKKSKRGKKINDSNHANGDTESKPALTKKERKKNADQPIPEEKETENEEQSTENENPVVESTEVNDEADANGHTDDKQSAIQGKKKQPAKNGRGRKNVKQEIEIPEEIEDKPKPAGKTRGRKAQPKAETEDSTGQDEEMVKKPATKGKKKGTSKVAKEKSPDKESGSISENDNNEVNMKEEIPAEETKSRKNGGRKAKELIGNDDDDIKNEAPVRKRRKITKKEEIVEPKDNGVVEDDNVEPKPVKGKRGQKKAVETDQIEEDLQDTGESTNKRWRKGADEKAPAEDKKQKAPAKNKASTDYDEIDFSNNSKTPDGKNWNFKIASWNVGGIRSWLSKGGLDYLKYEKPDILCLQEVKCAQDKLPDELANVPGYHAYWLSSDKDGYAGVGVYTTQLAINVEYGLQNEDLDDEGRIITAEYEHFYLICTYVPNAGRKLVTLPKRLQWNEEFRKYVQELDKKKPVIICGDMNVSHNEIDLANPKTNRKNAGFTDEERAGMTDLLGDGFVDTFRHLNPDKTGAYTFWTYMMNCRAKNVGWRLDYFIVSERLLSSICDSVIRDKVYGSDHCPLSLFLHVSSADKPKE